MNLKINDILNGFRLIKSSKIFEIDAQSFEFEHVKTGAKLLYLNTNDDNKVFYICFRTPPYDDTGVAHIVEHSVLCGSQKYPLKEPFIELVKGSLNTFLNAITYPDKTVYPIASRNAKDFRNLQDVYLDAVFYPIMLSTPEILMQEGWHYEIEGIDEPLTYSGVVFNEMKGALSAPEDILSSKILHEIFPQNCYHFQAGGEPEAIPKLTQEMFVKFHSRYYHPSNSFIYLYGDIDIAEQLDYLDRKYLSNFEKIKIDSTIKLQSEFKELKIVEDSYPIGIEDTDTEKTFLALNFMVGDVFDSRTNLGLSILSHALFSSPAALIRKVLIDSGLGKDVDVLLEDDLRQPLFSIILNGSEKWNSQKFYALVISELEKIVNNGIDKNLLQASINLIEFKLREADFGSTPRGLIFGLRLLKSWLYNGDANIYLRYEEDLTKIKAGLSKGYFERLIKKWFLYNSHKVLITLSPDKEYSMKRDRAQLDELAKIKSQMTSEEIQKIIKTTESLKIRQQSLETQENLEKIPLLKLNEIRKETEYLPMSFRDLDGTRILFSNLDTQGIIYLNFYFDAEKVPQEKLFHAYLLTELLGNVDTRRHSYEELATLTNLNIGGFGINLHGDSEKSKPDSLTPRLKIFVKFLGSKLTETTDILDEIFNETIFTNKKHLREIIEQEHIELELNLQNSANQIVSSRIAAYQTKAGAYNAAGYLPYYNFLSELLINFDEKFEELVEELYETYHRLINRNDLIVNITANEQLYKKFIPQLSRLLKSLNNNKLPKEKYFYECVVKNEGLYSQSRVQYVGKGANFIKLGYSYSGVLSVLETILRYEYFWTRIRVQGGAYGAFANFNRNGELFFGSYRDPNLSKTLEVFDSTPEFLESFEISEREMTKYIIGTISRIDKPLTPALKGQIATELCLNNITFEDRQKARDEILSTRQKDIRALSVMIRDCINENILCVFGNEETIKQNREIFGEIKSALN